LGSLTITKAKAKRIFTVAKRLYVGGLSYDTSESELEHLFSQAGTVDAVKVVFDRDSGRSKGFGFVEMSSEGEASRAISLLNGTQQGGREIKVSQARPQGARSSGNGGANGYGGWRGGNGYGRQ
jgi:cold-inducible RNA-binding protein